MILDSDSFLPASEHVTYLLGTSVLYTYAYTVPTAKDISALVSVCVRASRHICILFVFVCLFVFTSLLE